MFACWLVGDMWTYHEPGSVSWDLTFYYMLLDRQVNVIGSRMNFPPNDLGTKNNCEAYTEALSF